MSKAMIAMSGGVDSSVSAALMLEQGYDCMGVTMKLYARPEDLESESGKTCCSLDDVEDARAVAHRLGMPHYVFNFQNDFSEQVIDRFVEVYEKGATPNPCIDCNRYLKFDRLYQRAITLGCDTIVTGHYARIEQAENGRYLLKKARNPAKDQSYVLYFLTQEQLAHTCFPLGVYESKDEIRRIAEKYGFVNAHKGDSQDICFVPDGDYVRFIEQYTGKQYPCGNYCDLQGNVLGQHKGVIGYTIGQRKGLGIALGKPMYVCGKCVDTNTVYLGENEDLFSDTLTAHHINLIPFDRLEQPMRLAAKIRYNQKEQPATVEQIDADTLKITFDMPQRAIAKGQAVVLYDGDTVVGGGTIA
ncbi:MAG: tRNA 2-thiouridine(34) synthase MnmA [Ruminococcus sp.]|nr:tRNA 2-thiouridine(34) synthase MnmA [Ruminococcus sp.]